MLVPAIGYNFYLKGGKFFKSGLCSTFSRVSAGRRVNGECLLYKQPQATQSPPAGHLKEMQIYVFTS